MDATKVKVRDLMVTHVARLDAAMPIDDAVELLEADHISGAPVVDEAGRVVGVLSLNDVARAKGSEVTTIGSTRLDYHWPEPGIDDEDDEFSAMDDYNPDVLTGGTVAEWMSQDVVAVAPDDSARVACKRMRERGIHRVLVLDDQQLVGILSSFDVVRWIADKG